MSKSSSSGLKTLESFLQTSFDYLIVGGGTAGLAVAARLSEDSQHSVGVLEAGDARLNDPSILMPAAARNLVGNRDYDWLFKTVPQASTSFRPNI